MEVPRGALNIDREASNCKDWMIGNKALPHPQVFLLQDVGRIPHEPAQRAESAAQADRMQGDPLVGRRQRAMVGRRQASERASLPAPLPQGAGGDVAVIRRQALG